MKPKPLLPDDSFREDLQSGECGNTNPQEGKFATQHIPCNQIPQASSHSEIEIGCSEKPDPPCTVVKKKRCRHRKKTQQKYGDTGFLQPISLSLPNAEHNGAIPNDAFKDFKSCLTHLAMLPMTSSTKFISSFLRLRGGNLKTNLN